MSVQGKTKDKSAKEYEKQIEYLEQQLYDAAVYASMLRDGCEAVLKCRDLVLQHGSQASILKVCDCVELAMHAADLFSPFPAAAEEMEGCIYCSVCERFFGIDSETAGRCLNCERSGMS